MPEGADLAGSPVSIALPNSMGGDCYVPDLCVYDIAVEDNGDEWKLPAAAFLLVAEVVSRSSQNHDRETKPQGYASGPIPLYLLIDPLRSEVTLFSDPANGRYQTVRRVDYGGKIPFPAPFDAVLDTSIFVR